MHVASHAGDSWLQDYLRGPQGGLWRRQSPTGVQVAMIAVIILGSRFPSDDG